MTSFTVTFVDDIPVAIEINGRFRRVELTATDLAQIDAKFRLDPQPVTFLWEDLPTNQIFTPGRTEPHGELDVPAEGPLEGGAAPDPE